MNKQKPYILDKKEKKKKKWKTIEKFSLPKPWFKLETFHTKIHRSATAPTCFSLK